eukprot:10099138-Ditylum_brightwellii.AAC.1
MGTGGEDIKILLTFLDLPHAWSFARSALKTFKDEVGETIRGAAIEEIEKGLEEEIKLTLEKNMTNGKKAKMEVSCSHTRNGGCYLTTI